MSFTSANRIIAVCMIALLTVAMLIVFVYDMITGRAIPSTVTEFIALIVGYVVNMLGVQHGVAITNDTTTKAAVAVASVNAATTAALKEGVAPSTTPSNSTNVPTGI